VIVATRQRPSQLAACLDSLLRLEYPKLEIIVVDNDPDDTATESLVTDRYAGKVVYTIERARGLASAHNRGVLAAHGRILAFTDDDVVVDADWASALVEAFRANPRAGCVTGLILPAQLETRPQAMLERRGGFAKGFRLAEHSDRVPGTHPLFPFTAGRLGSGANMAFTAEALHRIGGFDRTLGAGTYARGGDDLLAFFRTAAAGRSVVYQPDALVWHHHRREPRALADQAYGYGVGLGAYLTAALVNEPRMIVPLLRKLPRGAAYALRNSRADQSDPAAWPARLARLERYGLCYGPIAYGRSRWKARGVGRVGGSV
jgi:GT2 family glycosyltransferase